MKYTVFFEIGGKKLKTLVEANSETDAKNKVKEKIIFHKVKDELSDLFSDIDKILGFKK